MIYVLITVITLICALILGIRKNYASVSPKKYILAVCGSAVVTSIVAGLIIGTAYSHGLDFTWWMFSILSFLIVVLPAFVLMGILHFRMLLLKKYKS